MGSLRDGDAIMRSRYLKFDLKQSLIRCMVVCLPIPLHDGSLDGLQSLCYKGPYHDANVSNSLLLDSPVNILIKRASLPVRILHSYAYRLSLKVQKN